MTEGGEGILRFWPSFIADFINFIYVDNFYQGVAVMAFLTLSAIVAAEISRSAESARTRLRSKVILSVSLLLWLVNLIFFTLATIEAAYWTQTTGGSYRAVVSGMGIVLTVHLIVGFVLAAALALILILPRNPKDDEALEGGARWRDQAIINKPGEGVQ